MSTSSFGAETDVQAGQQALAAGNRHGLAVGVREDLISVGERSLVLDSESFWTSWKR